MAESTIDLIFRIRKSGSGSKDAAADLKAVKGSANDAVKALTGFDIAGLGAAGAIAGVAAAAVGAVKETLAWAGAIDKLSRNTGLSTEEASKLAIVAGDVGIEIGTLERTLKELNKDGLELNFETLKKVSEQYNATTDPVKRLKIATDAFGKSAMDMTEILSRTPKELDALAKSAELSGRVMSQDSVAAAEEFEQSLKMLQDRAKGLQVTFGNAVIPVLLDAGQAYSDLTRIAALANLQAQKNIGVIDQEQLTLRAAAVAAGDLAAVYVQQLNPAVLASVDANERQREKTVDVGTASIDTALLLDDLAASTTTWKDVAARAEAEAAMKLRLDDLTGAASDLAFGMGELTTATLFNQAAQVLDADAAYELAKQMGLIDPAADAAKQILDEYIKANDGSKEATERFKTQVGLLNDAIGALPAGKTITIEYIEQYRRELNADLGRDNDRQGGAIGEAYGADFVVPPGYPNDTYRMNVQSGEHVTVTPAGMSATSNTAWGGVTINVSGAGDPTATARAVERQLISLAAKARAQKSAR